MSTKGIDFTRLTLEDALDLAVLIEEEARERYQEFAEQMELHRTAEAASFFRFMARNEEKHRAELAARRAELSSAPARVGRAMLFDVEAPEYDEARAFMSAREALEAALRAEQKAHAFFEQALPHVDVPDVRALFEELRDEELEHQALVKKELERLPPDEPFSAESFADDPVGQ